mmetsp:Transcript_18716/g.25936  ORF Transcript_18716/g.25936 Transcript_18716/m.25936 type:complete len:191 (+) Transcript_18716:187-759(+)
MSEVSCKKCQQVLKPEAVNSHGGVLYEDDTWIVVHKGSPIGVEGHLQLVSKRHFQGPADMNDVEATTVGSILRHCESILKQVTSAKQIYSAALGASFPHFHCHMVPVFPDAIKEVLGIPWDVFLQEKLAADKILVVDEAKCLEISNRFKEAIAKSPPPITVIKESKNQKANLLHPLIVGIIGLLACKLFA